jgi:hypothetical protein
MSKKEDLPFIITSLRERGGERDRENKRIKVKN